MPSWITSVPSWAVWRRSSNSSLHNCHHSTTTATAISRHLSIWAHFHHRHHYHCHGHDDKHDQQQHQQHRHHRSISVSRCHGSISAISQYCSILASRQDRSISRYRGATVLICQYRRYLGKSAISQYGDVSTSRHHDISVSRCQCVSIIVYKHASIIAISTSLSPHTSTNQFRCVLALRYIRTALFPYLSGQQAISASQYIMVS